MTWKLVNSIVDDKSIKEGLFPSPGGNQSVSKGGSRSKADYHWALARHIFEDDEEYGPFFNRATSSADKKAWGRKIKNRLQRCVILYKEGNTLSFVPYRIIKDVRGFIAEMGQTGMGIVREDELDMSLNNHITNCWSQ